MLACCTCILQFLLQPEMQLGKHCRRLQVMLLVWQHTTNTLPYFCKWELEIGYVWVRAFLYSLIVDSSRLVPMKIRQFWNSAMYFFLLLLALQSFMDLDLLDDPPPDIPYHMLSSTMSLLSITLHLFKTLSNHLNLGLPFFPRAFRLWEGYLFARWVLLHSD
jgi:hypothetical protein